jgi:hypothetical protein
MAMLRTRLTNGHHRSEIPLFTETKSSNSDGYSNGKKRKLGLGVMNRRRAIQCLIVLVVVIRGIYWCWVGLVGSVLSKRESSNNKQPFNPIILEKIISSHTGLVKEQKGLVAWAAKQKEALNQLQSNNNNNNNNNHTSQSSSTFAIDDYYQRPHIRQPVPLIVGGSDGSGTRAFVQILEQLKVPMLMDNPTKDIDGVQLFDGAGWPPLVSLILNHTHSADYSLTDLPRSVFDTSSTEMAKLVHALNDLGRNKSESMGASVLAHVTYGFKAPVSQLLLPLFQNFYPAFKFLHIVRDGRDIALSDNRSPVAKFYKDYYQDASQRSDELLKDGFDKDASFKVKSMQLWNDWNYQVYQFGRNHANGHTLDVLVMRTEDLLANRYESILKLADFVGSAQTPNELCCISNQRVKDMGRSQVRLGLEFDTGLDNSPLSRVRRGMEGMLGMHQDVAARREEYFRKRDQMPAKRTEFFRNEDRDHPGRRRLVSESMAATENDNAVPNAAQTNTVERDNLPIRPPLDAWQPRRLSTYKKLGPIERYSMHGKIDKQLLLEARRGTGHGHFRSQYVKVNQRYGKWVDALASQPKLSQRLHQEGRSTLELFGYEPPQHFMDMTTNPIFDCTSEVKC